MDKRTVITCIYTVTESVYSSIQMNKDILTINNHWQDVSLCYQDNATIGSNNCSEFNSELQQYIKKYKQPMCLDFAAEVRFVVWIVCFPLQSQQLYS